MKAAAALASSAAAGALSDGGGLVLSSQLVPQAGPDGRIKVGLHVLVSLSISLHSAFVASF